MIAINRIPVSMAPVDFRGWIEGYGVQFEPDSVHQWLVIDGKTYFDRHDPVPQERDDNLIRLRARWSEPPETPPRTPPPARFYPEVTLAPDGAGRLLARPNFVLKSAWGFDTGPLPLQQTACR